MRRIAILCTFLLACDGRLFGNGGESDLAAKVEERLAAAEQARIDRAEGRLTSAVVRLSNREYVNTLASLFPTLTLDDLSLPAESLSSGYDNNAFAQSTVGQTVEQSHSKLFVTLAHAMGGERRHFRGSETICGSMSRTDHQRVNSPGNPLRLRPRTVVSVACVGALSMTQF